MRSTFLPYDAAIERELLVMTDSLTDEIVAGFRAEVERVIFGVSRLVVDPERFTEPLRVLSATERRRLMEPTTIPTTQDWRT
jgi:hypothetical protein